MKQQPMASETDWTVWGIIGTLIIGVAGWIRAIFSMSNRSAASNAKAKAADEKHAALIADHEKRIRSLEEYNARLARMESDVSWIKKTLETMSGHSGGTNSRDN